MKKQFSLVIIVSLFVVSTAFAKPGDPQGTVMVTGGAGYIGSHTVHQLVEAGEKVVVLDNLYSGHRWAVPASADFVLGDVGDTELVAETIKKYNVHAILHFAAHIKVKESIENPQKYFQNNFINATKLIETARDNGVKYFVFSSTCSVYGDTKVMPVTESHPTNPPHPYAASKLMTEDFLRAQDKHETHPLRSVVLRYFNVAGAKVIGPERVSGRIGQATPGSKDQLSVIKNICKVMTGEQKEFSIFGTDYDTRDGTCIRDYIHVDDLAAAHVLALNYLRAGNASNLFNLGYGTGYTIRELVETMKAVSGIDFPVVESGRRDGDIIEIYANPSKVKTMLNWQPQHEDLGVICRTAYEWEQYYRDHETALEQQEAEFKEKLEATLSTSAGSLI